MSVHNAISRFPQLSRALHTFCGLDDDAEGIARLSETLYPTVDVFDVPELRFLRGEYTYAAELGSGAGGAGTRSHIGIRNPVGSGKLLVVEQFQVANLSGAVRTYKWMRESPPTAGATTATGTFVENRNPTQSACLTVAHAAGAVLGTIFWIARVAADAIYELPFPLILQPDVQVIAELGADNVGINGSAEWRERFLLPRELRA